MGEIEGFFQTSTQVRPSLPDAAMASLADLPEDVILHILQLCAIEDALTLTQVCPCNSVRPFECY